MATTVLLDVSVHDDEGLDALRFTLAWRCLACGGELYRRAELPEPELDVPDLAATARERIAAHRCPCPRG